MGEEFFYLTSIYVIFKYYIKCFIFMKYTKEDLKKKLTHEQYYVTQTCGTEAPFQNEYWDNKESGIYVDILTGKPLFASIDKFDSGTGWPSFIKPIEKEIIEEKNDLSFGIKRIEVKSKSSGSHLGHLFKDGPKPTGLRYCINSAALQFIHKKDFTNKGYAKYLKLFKEASNE